MAAVTSSPFETPGWRQRLLAAPRSLKARCLQSIALVSGLTWLVVSLAIVGFAQHEADAMADASLHELAHMALAFADHELAEIKSAGGPNVTDDVDESFSNKLMYQVWQPGPVLAYRSGNAPADEPLTSGASGFGQSTRNGETLRSYTEWNADKSFQIQMVALPAQRESYSARVSLALCIGLLSALLLFQWLMRQRIDSAFAPLNDTADALSRKTAADLSPVSVDGQLTELTPVIEAFNGLMSRMSQSLRHEQRFTSDAAHELRTPLSGLKVLVRNVQRAGSEPEREVALGQMEHCIDRSTVLIDQLLALARYDRDPSRLKLDEPVNLHDVARSVLLDLQPLAEEQGVQPQLREDGNAPGPAAQVLGNRHALVVALRNLVENALLHAPAGGRVTVEVLADPATHSVGWRVHDNGPGVPPELCERVFARFFRLDRSSSRGAGLGLALVRRIVDIHGGRVCMSASPLLGGTQVEVRLPAPGAVHSPA